jgi:hypothetical protein
LIWDSGGEREREREREREERREREREREMIRMVNDEQKLRPK